MRNSYSLGINLEKTFRSIMQYDKNEIDNPDEYSLSKINYMNRINKVISVIKKHFEPSLNIKIADFGCAQGNISLILAEMGYKVFAVDMRQDFLEYSKLKYEKGEIEWICLNIENIKDCYKNEFFDAIVLGELIEHCAYPENILQIAFHLLKKGGILIITTPNGNYLKNKLPTFSSIKECKSRSALEINQFGPDGVNHLFLFDINDIKGMLPAGAQIEQRGFIGSAIINRHSCRLLRFLPSHFIYWSIEIFEKLPFLNRVLSLGIYWIIVKK